MAAPASGVRVRLDRLDQTDNAATYRAVVMRAGGDTSEFLVALTRGTEPRIEAEGAVDDARARRYVAAVAKVIAKGSDWPRRVERWRPEESA